MNEGWPAFLILGLIVSGIIGTMIGDKAQKGTEGFFFGLLLGPVGWIIIAVLAAGDSEGKVQHELEQGSKVACPACYSAIDWRATICPHCRTEIPKKSAPAAAVAVTVPAWEVTVPSAFKDSIYLFVSKVLGPFSAIEVADFLAEHRASEETLFSFGTGQWRPLKEISVRLPSTCHV